jgi:hypothetical protein
VLPPIRLGQFDVPILRGFIAAAKQDHYCFAIVREKDAMALAHEYPQLAHSLPHRFPVPGQTERQAIELNKNSRLGLWITQLCKPAVNRHDAVGSTVFANFRH